MAETDPKAAPSSSASGNASSSSAAAAQAAVREAAQAQADDQRFRRLHALERPNTAPAAQPRAEGESLTNLHNGSRTEVFIDDDATPAAGLVVEKAAAPAVIGGGSGVAPSDLSSSNAAVMLPAGPAPENNPVAGDSSTTFLTLGEMDGTSAALDGSGGRCRAAARSASPPLRAPSNATRCPRRARPPAKAARGAAQVRPARKALRFRPPVGTARARLAPGAIRARPAPRAVRAQLAPWRPRRMRRR
ncbi:hypothetical protein [Azospirillum agricola]|uniref:hypothetical protein n=1 Tax=Azospirillum agricola TaxID=1720247 RepID=UPI00117789CE|nr:hypothetical protein [Azospirillum agricola]